MKEFAAAQWQRAHRTLATARQLADTDPDSAASRAYYAAFHAVTALFALRGQTFSKHSGVRSALHRHLIHTDQWEQDLGRAYDLLMDLRETGDYGGQMHVTEANAATAVENAIEIIQAVERSCPEISEARG